jgi:YfiR/HmsC-like
VGSWQVFAVAGIGLGGVLGGARLSTGAGADRSLEYPVKAAFLVNFAKFAEWPADSLQARAAAVSICVMGRDPFGEVLEKAVSGRSAGGRPIVVQRYGSIDATRACHVLFVAASESGRLGPILERLANTPVLTVSERDGFARQGGVIGLVVQGNLVRFEVNLQVARHKGLVLSSKLLGVARVVEDLAAGEH